MVNCGSTTFTLPMNTPVRVFVSNWASCVAVISVGPFGRSLLSAPKKSPVSADPAAGLAVPGARFDPAAFCPVVGVGECFVAETGLCCAKTPSKVPKQVMIPNRMTNFFTDLLLTSAAGLRLKFIPIVKHQMDIPDHFALARF